MSGGLGNTDKGDNTSVIGGLALEFFTRVCDKVCHVAALLFRLLANRISLMAPPWHPIPITNFLFAKTHGGRELTAEGPCFQFAPSAAASTFEDMISEAKSIRYLRGLQLVGASPSGNGQGLASLQLQRADGSGAVTAKGSVFIDASYEGDLLAVANVPFTVGREGVAAYNESIAGRLKVGWRRRSMFCALF